jgi:hypothetical protein
MFLVEYERPLYKAKYCDGGGSNTSHAVVCEESLNIVVSHLLFHVRTDPRVRKMAVREDC